MGIFQKAYDWFKGLKSPEWFIKLTDYIMSNIIIPVLTDLAEGHINELKNLIMRADKHTEWSGEQKFEYVFNGFKASLDGWEIEIKDHTINLLIEMIFSQLKKQGFIR